MKTKKSPTATTKVRLAPKPKVTSQGNSQNTRLNGKYPSKLRKGQGK
jgi:hypothetical protein